MGKICFECNIDKNINDFYIRIKGKRNTYYYTECKICMDNNKNIIKQNIINEKIKYKNKKELLKKQKLYIKQYNKKNYERLKIYRKNYKNTENGKKHNQINNNKRRALIKNVTIKDITKEMLDNLYVSQNKKCNYCKTFLDFGKKRFVHLDHIYPISKGGIHSINNLQYLCQKCNLSKNNKVYLQKK